MYYVYVDEAGRGPIAGPVYVGIVVEQITDKKSQKTNSQLTKHRSQLFDTHFDHSLLFDKYAGYDDSKVLSETKRKELYATIIADENIKYSSGSARSTDIDNKGIVRGIRTSIAKALYAYFGGEKKFSEKTFMGWLQDNRSELTLVIDGKTDFGIKKLWGVSVETIVDGDALVPMISAASIVAKVERDREMHNLHKKFPSYGFDRHKGYGTKAHYLAIAKHGISKQHRTSFLRKLFPGE